MIFFLFLHSHRHLLLFHLSFELHFLSLNLHLHSHYICFVNVFDWLILAIIEKTFKFTSSILFKTHILSDRSLRVLQLSLKLSKLIVNG